MVRLFLATHFILGLEIPLQFVPEFGWNQIKGIFLLPLHFFLPGWLQGEGKEFRETPQLQGWKTNSLGEIYDFLPRLDGTVHFKEINFLWILPSVVFPLFPVGQRDFQE